MTKNLAGRAFLVSCLIWFFAICGSAYGADYTISVDSPTVVEGGVLTFTVTVSPQVASLETVTVTWATTNSGTAQEGSDFTAVSATDILFNPGDDSASFTVTTTDETTWEANETVEISLINSSSGGTVNATSASTATGTITNDDTVGVSITGGDQTVAESVTSKNYTIEIDQPLAVGESVTVDYIIIEGPGTAATTARADYDYVNTFGTLTFDDTATSQDITVTILNDTIYEGSDEKFTLKISSVSSNAAIITGEVVTTITDDDTVGVFIATADLAVAENAYLGNWTQNYTVALDQSLASGESVTVDYRIIPGPSTPATAGSDYVNTSGTLTFTSADGSKTIPVTIINDAVYETSSENFTLEIYNQSANAVILDSQVITTIDDNDHIVSITTADLTVDEDKVATTSWDQNYTVEINPPLVGSETLTVQYRIIAGPTPPATAGSDYVNTAGTLTFTSAATSQTVSVTIINDAVYEANDEKFTLEIYNPSVNASIADNSVVTTIDDNDHNISIATIASPVDEESGPARFQIIVVPALEGTDVLTVSYRTVDGTVAGSIAVAGADYVAGTAQLTFTSAPATNPQTVDIAIVDDTTLESDETFSMEIYGPSSNGTITTASDTVTITDHDYEVTIVGESVFENAGPATFTVSLTPAPKGSDVVSVRVDTEDGTALAGSDYTALVNGTVFFRGPTHATPSSTPQTVDIAILSDDIAEGLETYKVKLSNPSVNATLPNPEADGGIFDDDYTVSSFADISVDEDAGTISIPVTLNRQVVGSDVKFTVSVTDVSTVPADYTLLTSTLTFVDGVQSQNIQVTITDDAFIEHAETLTVKIVNTTGNVVVSGVTTPSDTATVTINVDEKYNVSVNDPTPIEEANTTVAFTISVSPTPTADDQLFSIDYKTTDGSAESGLNDYIAVVPGSVAYAIGESTKDITVSVLDDAIDEGVQEQFYLDLTGTSDPDIVTITDNRGVCTILDVPYVVTPSWTTGGQLTLESPSATAVTISNGTAVGIQDNTDAIFTVTADYEITKVTIDGTVVPIVGSVPAALAGYITRNVINPAEHKYTFVDLNTSDGAHTIAVEFDHNVALTASGDGQIIAPGSVTPPGANATDGSPINVYADHGSTETFTIAPNGGSVACVTDVIEDGVSQGSFTGTTNKLSHTISSITSNRTLEAVFDKTVITVLLGANDGATGTAEDLVIQNPLNGSGWRAYLTDASYNVSGGTFIKEGEHGESFTIPDDIPAQSCDARYFVIEYLESDGWLKPGNDQLDLNTSMTDQTVEGLYDANSHVLELVFDHGTILIDPKGTPAVGANRYLYISDVNVQLTPVADVGWVFQGWTQDASGTADPLTVVMNKDKKVEVIFGQACKDNDHDGYEVDPGDGSCTASTLPDCNDSNALIHPGAKEICEDGIDQDCTGADLICAGDDADDDYDGYTENQGDCDDNNYYVHPGLTDIPGNGIDEDCFDGDKFIGLSETCVSPSDIPANASRKPAPPLIMFLLDDSGSMDWEFMTSESNQLFNSRYYVYDYDVDARIYDNYKLTDTQRRQWLSQWYGENRIFFNPNVVYDPWPLWDLVAASIPSGSYDGSEEMLVRPHETNYNTDNTIFPDSAFADGFVHADMDDPRNNTLDSEDGHSWSYIADDGVVGRHTLALNAEFFNVTAGGKGQVVIVTRDSLSSPASGDTRADAIGLSTRNDLQLNTPHYWTWYDTIPYDANPANDAPSIIFDDLDGSDIYSATNNWNPSGGTHAWEWKEHLWWTETIGEFATWRLNLTAPEAAAGAAAGGYYVYAWIDEYYNSDANAKYTIFDYDGSGNLQSEDVRVNQRPDPDGDGTDEGPRWILLKDKKYNFIEQDGSNQISIKNAHYFVWSDTNSNGSRDLGEIYLINIPGTGHSVGNYSLEYYQFNDLNSNDYIDDGELVELTTPADYAAIKPVRFNAIGVAITADDELAYVVRQNFADWYSFYRRRILTAKAAVGLTVADMDSVELGVHTINQSTHEPLQLMVTAGGAEKLAYLGAIYNINPTGNTPLGRGLNDVGQYFKEGNTGDAAVLQTTEGLPAGDTSVFWDATVDDDLDDIDDSGGECQRAYVIAMTDGYYNIEFTIANEDGNSVYALSDSISNTIADITDKYYHMDLDTTLANLLPTKGFDDSAAQHLVTFGVSFGVFGQFDPKLYPDCLPACDTPGQDGCPELEDLGKVDDCITNASGDIECKTCTEDSDGAITCSATRSIGPFENMCPQWHTVIGSANPKSIDDLFHASVNGRGKFLNAADPAELVSSMKAIKDLIEESEGTASSVSINSNKIEANTLLFQTSYDSGDWSGDIEAKCLDSSGDVAPCARVSCESSCDAAYESCLVPGCALGDLACEAVCVAQKEACYTTNNCEGFQTCSGGHTTCVSTCYGDTLCEGACNTVRATCLENPPEIKWSASKKLDTVLWSNRQIITSDASGNGLPFQWGDNSDATADGLTLAMKSLFDGEQKQLNYIRGDHDCEQGNTTGCTKGYRARESKLGDFISAEPYYYKNAGLAIDWVIAGANDGMLHVFNGSDGEEIFSYIPITVYTNVQPPSTPVKKFPEFVLPSYSDTHRFFVDGFTTVKELGNASLLVGGLGKGGRGFYGLDLTKAVEGIALDTIEGYADQIVKWELNTSTPSSVAIEDTANSLRDHLGYSFSRPQIIKSNDTSAQWLLVFGNGYDSASSQAVLFLVGLDNDGEIVWTHTINTGVGEPTPANESCNGLSSPAIIFPQGDRTNDFIFAGDLLGNMWKFDISDPDRSNWGVYFQDSSAANPNKPLFTAKSNEGYPQPITMQPDVTTTCVIGTEGYLVAFGTGRLYDPVVDNLDMSVQSIYGIWDWSAEWEAQGETTSDKYLGEFEPQSAAIGTDCSNTCISIGNDCDFDCLGNTECELNCANETQSCISNCSSVRNLSNMASVIDATSSPYISLLQQTQVSVNGLIYNSDGTLKSQEYGNINLNDVDQVVRTMSDNDIKWMLPTEASAFSGNANKIIHHVGWYFDLPGNGERSTKDVIIASGKLIFTTSTPSDTPCSGGGTSSIWSVEVCSGGRTSYAYFDLNGDGVINQNDYINIGTEADPIWVAPSSVMVEGISPAPTLIEVEKNIDKLFYPNNEEDTGLSGLGTPGYGLPILYWRELNWQ